MATEPITTSPHYDPKLTYNAPVGRLPILGKARAEVDRLRAATANDLNTILNRNLAQIDSNAKITGELAALATQTIDNTRKVTADISAQEARTLNETNKTAADIIAQQASTLNETNKVTADISHINASITKIDADIVAQEARTLNETNKVTAEIDVLVLELDKINADMIAQEARTLNETNKVTAEITAMGIQSANDTTRTVNDTNRTTNDTTKAINDTNRAINEVMTNTQKTDAEVALLTQKKETELAQVADAVTTGTVFGVIGKQKELFEQQRQGFIRDAEQKLAKILVDTWTIRQSTAGGIDVVSAGLDNTDIASVLGKAKQGIGV